MKKIVYILLGCSGIWTASYADVITLTITLEKEKIAPLIEGETNKEKSVSQKEIIADAEEVIPLEEAVAHILESRIEEVVEETSAAIQSEETPIFEAPVVISSDTPLEVVESLVTKLEDLKEKGASGEECEDVKQLYHLQDMNTAVLKEALDQKLEQVTIEIKEVIHIQSSYIGDDGLEYFDDEEMPEREDLSNQASNPFQLLPLRHTEKKNIYKIVSTIADKSLPQLLLEKKEMEKRGDQIHHVHPMRFIGYILSDPYLKRCLVKIKGNSFKWSNFMDGYCGRMREEASKNNLEKFIEGFCLQVTADQEEVLQYIRTNDYEGLVVALL